MKGSWNTKGVFPSSYSGVESLLGRAEIHASKSLQKIRGLTKGYCSVIEKYCSGTQYKGNFCLNRQPVQ